MCTSKSIAEKNSKVVEWPGSTHTHTVDTISKVFCMKYLQVGKSSDVISLGLSPNDLSLGVCKLSL